MSRIQNLSNHLSVIGYSGYEITHIINSVTGGKHLTALSGGELSALADTMEHYVAAGQAFAATYSK